MNGTNYWKLIKADPMVLIFSKLKYNDLYRCKQVCKVFHRYGLHSFRYTDNTYSVIERNSILEKFELNCFHSKKNYKEDVLGITVASPAYVFYDSLFNNVLVTTALYTVLWT